MSPDAIRAYVYRTCIEPARVRGETEVTIRVGDVCRALSQKDDPTRVFSALGTNIFERTYSVKKAGVDGPTASENSLVTFRLL